MKTYKAALIGIGGFGGNHAKVMLELAEAGLLEIVAFAELHVDRSPDAYARLTAAGAVHYEDYEQMLQRHPEVDFVTIATPIAAHRPMCVKALDMGFHVIVEKPPAVTIQDVDDMIEARRRSGRLCQVNFQNTSGQAARKLIELLRAGALGRITDVTGLGMWKRDEAYYARTGWAGKLTHNGMLVLDGTINNPLAHLLHNCLLFAGGGEAAKAAPEWVQAELYHANRIESEDTSCVRIGVAGGATVHFFATVCHDRSETPSVRIRGTEGEALWTYENKLTVRNRDGESTWAFGPEHLVENMYRNMMAAIGRGEPLYAPIDDCRSFMAASNGAFLSAGAVRTIPDEYVREDVGEGGVVSRNVPGLSSHMREAAEQRKLFSEYPFPWAVRTSPFRMEGYSRFELPEGMRLG